MTAQNNNNVRTIGVGLSIVAGAMLFGALTHAVGQGQMAFAAGDADSLVQVEPLRAEGDLGAFVLIVPEGFPLAG